MFCLTREKPQIERLTKLNEDEDPIPRAEHTMCEAANCAKEGELAGTLYPKTSLSFSLVCEIWLTEC